MHRALSLTLLLIVAGPGAASAAAPRVWLVKDGKPAADVYAGAAEWETAERLAARVEQWTGARLALFGASEPPEGRRHMARVLIGTPKSLPEIAHLSDKGPAGRELGEEGYLLAARADPATLLVTGATPVAVLYGVGELLNYRLEVEKGNVWCEPFEAAERPALRYRWFWLSTSYAHWDATYGGPHITDEVKIEPARYPGQFLGKAAYVNTYEAMIDWMSEHRLNGALIFGYLNQGVGPGREVARYGRAHGVDVLAGVGTMGYWGAYYGGENEYNLDALMKIRPELFKQDSKGRLIACPSRPGMRDYWKRSGRWLAEALPELGGLYLENGDFARCPCAECKANRARAENDTGCYWDLMASEVPVIEGASAVRPDWKFAYAAYTSFTPAGLRRGTERSPPHFPGQFPAAAICQWTVTGMDDKDWPPGLKAPAAHSVGLFHSPSVWGKPDGAGRWWAGPGSSHDDASCLVRLYCNRMAGAGFEGLVVKGMKNNHSPGPLLTYLALEEFSWHPERTPAQWERERLGRLFGGADRAALYLHLARDGARGAAARQRLVREAEQVAADQTLSPRARPYWQDLVEELRYRGRLEATLPPGG